MGILQARILERVAYALFQGIFPTQGSSPGLLQRRRILYCLSHQGTSPGSCDCPTLIATLSCCKLCVEAFLGQPFWASHSPCFKVIYYSFDQDCLKIRRRQWQPTPVLLPGESQGQGSLVGFRLWGHIEPDTTEVRHNAIAAAAAALKFPSLAKLERSFLLTNRLASTFRILFRKLVIVVTLSSL